MNIYQFIVVIIFLPQLSLFCMERKTITIKRPSLNDPIDFPMPIPSYLTADFEPRQQKLQFTPHFYQKIQIEAGQTLEEKYPKHTCTLMAKEKLSFLLKKEKDDEKKHKEEIDYIIKEITKLEDSNALLDSQIKAIQNSKALLTMQPKENIKKLAASKKQIQKTPEKQKAIKTHTADRVLHSFPVLPSTPRLRRTSRSSQSEVESKDGTDNNSPLFPKKQQPLTIKEYGRLRQSLQKVYQVRTLLDLKQKLVDLCYDIDNEELDNDSKQGPYLDQNTGILYGRVNRYTFTFDRQEGHLAFVDIPFWRLLEEKGIMEESSSIEDCSLEENAASTKENYESPEQQNSTSSEENNYNSSDEDMNLIWCKTIDIKQQIFKYFNVALEKELAKKLRSLCNNDLQDPRLNYNEENHVLSGCVESDLFFKFCPCTREIIIRPHSFSDYPIGCYSKECPRRNIKK